MELLQTVISLALFFPASTFIIYQILSKLRNRRATKLAMHIVWLNNLGLYDTIDIMYQISFWRDQLDE